MISRQQEIRRNRRALRAVTVAVVVAVVLAIFALMAPPSNAATTELCMGKPLPAGQHCYRISPIEKPHHVRPYRPRHPRWVHFRCHHRQVWYCPPGMFCTMSGRS